MEFGVLLFSVMFLCFAVFGKMIYKCMINPITVFCGVWGIILLAYSFHAYDLYYASDDSIFLIEIGVLMFFLGAIVANSLVHRKGLVGRETSIAYNARVPHYNVILVLNLIAFVFLVGFGLTTIRMLLSGSNFYYIHRLYNQEEGTIGASRTYQNILSWFIWPLMDASLATLSVSLLCDKRENKLKKYTFIFTLVNLALFTIITGKRAHLGYLLMYIIAVRSLQGRRLNLKRRTKFVIAAGVVVIIWAFNAISVSRGSESIIKTLYMYLVGCVPHLSIKLQSFSFDPKGITSIYGFLQGPMIIVNSILHSSLLSSIRSSMGELIAITQARVQIAPGQTFNAFLTPFYYFYLDGGVIGNIVLSFIFGFASMYVYTHHLRKRSYKSMIVYLLVFFSLYMSFVRIQYFQMRYVLAFLYVIIFFKRFRIKMIFGHKKKDV